jgi:glutamate racemase
VDNRPIGIFDSGIGGLTVVARVTAMLPNEEIIYFGDTARLPYGSKTGETVTRFSREIARFLLRRNVKAVVVACNTASALALETLQRELPVDVLGVISPGADAACARTRSGRIGVIGTRATIRSGAYRRALLERRQDLVICEVATPLFVHLVEEGWTSGEIPGRIARHYLGELVDAGVDTVILGCTHYPLLAGMLADALGAEAALIDSAEETARALARVLERRRLAADRSGGGGLTCYASDVAEGFATLGARFLGRPLDRVEHVEQSDLPWFER